MSLYLASEGIDGIVARKAVTPFNNFVVPDARGYSKQIRLQYVPFWGCQEGGKPVRLRTTGETYIAIRTKGREDIGAYLVFGSIVGADYNISHPRTTGRVRIHAGDELNGCRAATGAAVAVVAAAAAAAAAYNIARGNSMTRRTSKLWLARVDLDRLVLVGSTG